MGACLCKQNIPEPCITTEPSHILKIKSSIVIKLAPELSFIDIASEPYTFLEDQINEDEEDESNGSYKVVDVESDDDSKCQRGILKQQNTNKSRRTINSGGSSVGSSSKKVQFSSNTVFIDKNSKFTPRVYILV